MSRVEREHGVQAAFFRSVAARVAVFAALWWGLTEGELGSWLLGIPAVVAATAASYWLRTTPGWRWRILGGLGFAVFFLFQSLRAGLDVARRAISLDIAPRIITYRVSLNQEAARTFFTGVISLLPGTLTTAIDRDLVHIHTLDARNPISDELARLEKRVAILFGETIACKRS